MTHKQDAGSKVGDINGGKDWGNVNAWSWSSCHQNRCVCKWVFPQILFIQYRIEMRNSVFRGLNFTEELSPQILFLSETWTLFGETRWDHGVCHRFVIISSSHWAAAPLSTTTNGWRQKGEHVPSPSPKSLDVCPAVLHGYRMCPKTPPAGLSSHLQLLNSGEATDRPIKPKRSPSGLRHVQQQSLHEVQKQRINLKLLLSSALLSQTRGGIFSQPNHVKDVIRPSGSVC